MRIVIRADSGTDIGSGHLMRCLTLADSLRESGVKVSFICRSFPGNLSSFPEKKGYKVHKLHYADCALNKTKESQEKQGWFGVPWETDAGQTEKIIRNEEARVDWLIIDQYALDKRWEKQMRSVAKKIMVIDDLADRQHDCDALLDQNYFHDFVSRYERLVPAGCKKFLGPRFSLLRDEFYKARKNLRERSGEISRILIFFGGTDPSSETIKALKAFELIKRKDIRLDVVVGFSNNNKDRISKICADLSNTKFYCQVDDMAQLIAAADISIGAGGTSVWERCFLGLPAIVIAIADNQKELTESVAGFGAIWSLGPKGEVDESDIAFLLEKAINNPEEIRKMSGLALELTRESCHGKEEILDYIVNCQ